MGFPARLMVPRRGRCKRNGGRWPRGSGRKAASGPPQYYDVTYRYNGTNRYVQMTRPPGPTITVNRDGEPRAAG